MKEFCGRKTSYGVKENPGKAKPRLISVEVGRQSRKHTHLRFKLSKHRTGSKISWLSLPENHFWGWTDDLAVKRTGYCSSRGLEFNFQHPHSNSKLYGIPVLRDVMPSSGTGTQMVHIHPGNAFVHTK